VYPWVGGCAGGFVASLYFDFGYSISRSSGKNNLLGKLFYSKN